MNTSARMVDMIGSFEGLMLKAYLCPAGVPTIGYGHTGPDVTRADVTARKEITRAEADRLLATDLVRFENGVSSLLDVEVTQNEFDALVSLAFNIGLGAFGKSTLRRLLNRGMRPEAAAQFTVWNKAGGKFHPGLLKRRTLELIHFMGAS